MDIFLNKFYILRFYIWKVNWSVNNCFMELRTSKDKDNEKTHNRHKQSIEFKVELSALWMKHAWQIQTRNTVGNAHQMIFSAPPKI